MEHTVRDNPDRQRYELVINDEIVSIADYRVDGDSVVVPHVETNPAHRGQGNADRLMAGMLDDLRATARTIMPLCPFAADYIDQHLDQQDLLTID